MRWRLACILGVWLALAPSPAPAQAPDPDRVQRGRVEFDAGREALGKGDLQGALAHFRRSLSFYPSPGTLLNLAAVEEKLGLFAAASGHYRDALRLLKEGDERVAIAKERIQAVEPRIPTVRVQLQGAAQPGLVVKLDGDEVAAFATGDEIRADPGSHVITMSAPGFVERRYDLTLQAGDRQTLMVPPLSPSAEPAGPKAATTAAPVTSASPAPSAAPAPPVAAVPARGEKPLSSGGTGLRTAGISALGAGGAAAIAGGVLGGLALSRRDELDAGCGGGAPKDCPPSLQPLHAEGQALAHAGTAAFVLAGVGVAAGITLLVVHAVRPGAKGSPAAKVSVGPAGLLVQGRF